ncbi:MAG: hypothetical protein IT445_11120 [Phycisphaeraceae bacterium]|nr:hypothetical protein [Phycisphaeraceae bacterium]
MLCPWPGHAQDASPQWYKGNTHTHSFWSDGNQFPEMIVDWYKNHGYQFLCLSDHNLLSEGEKWVTLSAMMKRVKDPAIDVVGLYRARFGDDWVETRQSQPDAEGKTELEVRLHALAEFRPMFEEPGAFLLIQAEEITESYEMKPVHTNAVNLQQAIEKQGGDSVRDVMRNHLLAVLAQQQQVHDPIMAHLNHPNFRWGITAEDLANVLEEEFFEVYNGHPATNHFGDDYRPGDERLWDIANTLRLSEFKASPLYALGTDDAHQYHGGDNPASPGKGWIMVRAAELSPAAIITAMRRGDFYASSGVTLRDIRYDPADRRITIEIDPAPGETYTTVFHGTRAGYDASHRDPTDAEGKPIESTCIYSDDVGAVLSTQTGSTVSYQLAGDELYVRATISSDRAPDNPSYENQVKQAWTQPFGWRDNVENMGTSRLSDPMQPSH